MEIAAAIACLALITLGWVSAWSLEIPRKPKNGPKPNRQRETAPGPNRSTREAEPFANPLSDNN